MAAVYAQPMVPYGHGPSAHHASSSSHHHAPRRDRGYRVCDQCGRPETPTASRFRLCGGCMTTQYCVRDTPFILPTSTDPPRSRRTVRRTTGRRTSRSASTPRARSSPRRARPRHPPRTSRRTCASSRARTKRCSLGPASRRSSSSACPATSGIRRCSSSSPAARTPSRTDGTSTCPFGLLLD